MITGALGSFVSSVNKTGGAFNLLYDLVEKSRDLLLHNAPSLDLVFENFEIEKYTCLHAGILRAKYMYDGALDREVLIIQTQSFFERCNVEDARKIVACIRMISQEFTNRLINWDLAVRGIQPLICCIRKLQKSPEQLTPLHGDVCQLAFMAKIFNPVLPLLNVDTLDVDRNCCVADGKDYLLYFYYGGMIYAALKKWDRGLQFFELCLIVPSLSLSCIFIEAAKKVILLSLIHNAKFSTVLDVPTPYLTSLRPWNRFCQPYLELASTFQHGSPEELNAVADRHRSVFMEDWNYGLVKQVLKSHVRFRIHSLTKTFMTMSLLDVANRVKLPSAEEAERYLLEMTESQAIFAHIDQRDGTVYFLDDPEQYNSAEMFMTLQKKIEECVSLEKHLMRTSDQLVKSPCYAKRMLELESKTTKTSGQY